MECIRTKFIAHARGVGPGSMDSTSIMRVSVRTGRNRVLALVAISARPVSSSW